MRRKSALVTGAGGFIGSHLCEKLIQEGYSVKALIRYNSRNHWGWLEEIPSNGKVDIIAGDIRNYDNIKSAMKGCEVVFHLAALIGIPYSYSSPEAYVDTNVKGTLNILQAAKELGTERIDIPLIRSLLMLRQRPEPIFWPCHFTPLSTYRL